MGRARHQARPVTHQARRLARETRACHRRQALVRPAGEVEPEQPARTPSGQPAEAGVFAFVMATGIVSVAAARQGLAIFSGVFFAIAFLVWLGSAAALTRRRLRLRRHRPPFESFAVVAATAVLGARFVLAGQNALALALWVVAALSWLALLLQTPMLGKPSGGSLLIVVATESLAVLAALLAPHFGADLLSVALAGWMLGLLLYPPVLGFIVRAMRRQRSFTPDLWIVMGALAIATLAAAELLLQARTLHELPTLRPWLGTAALALWSLASVLIAPLLTAELRTRGDWRYSALRWSFVFPLGMYALASHTLAQAETLAPLTWVGDAFFATAVAAWTLSLLGLARRSPRLLGRT